MEFLDWREWQQDPPAAWQRAPGRSPKALIKGGRVVRRLMPQITGIVLHQTACLYSASKAQIAASGGDRHKARNKRAQGIPAHAVVFQDGTIVIPSPLDWYLYHANGLNGHTLGIEVEGKYNGPKSLREVPDAQMEAARFALRWLVDTARHQGADHLAKIYAHRQSNGMKPADPGAELWAGVVVDYAVPVLGLQVEHNFVSPITPGTSTKPGRPIPKVWDRSATAPY